MIDYDNWWVNKWVYKTHEIEIVNQYGKKSYQHIGKFYFYEEQQLWMYVGKLLIGIEQSVDELKSTQLKTIEETNQNVALNKIEEIVEKLFDVIRHGDKLSVIKAISALENCLEMFSDANFLISLRSKIINFLENPELTITLDFDEELIIDEIDLVEINTYINFVLGRLYNTEEINKTGLAGKQKKEKLVINGNKSKSELDEWFNFNNQTIEAQQKPKLSIGKSKPEIKPIKKPVIIPRKNKNEK